MASRDFPLTLPSAEQLTPFFIAVGFAAAGALMGLISATGNPMLIAVSVGAIFGLLLLNALQVAVWVVLVGVLLISGPLFMFVPELTKTGWLFSILGFFLTGAAMLYPALGREQPRIKAPPFVWVGVLFVLWAIGLAFFSNGALSEIIAGVKRYFQFWGILFVLAVVPFKRRTVWRWLGFLALLSLLQLPLALYQRIVLVPHLTIVNAEISGFVAIDIVVGTFEGALQGGGSSSVMALFLVLVLMYLFSARRDDAISKGRFWLWFLLAAIPLGLGETKIVVILFPLALCMAYLDLVAKRPLLFASGAVVGLGLALAFVYIYLVVQAPDARELTFMQRLQETIDYNFGNVGYFGGMGLNRFTALTFWVQEHGFHDPVGTLFGHGLGSAYGGDGRVPNTGHVNDMYPNKLIGQTTAASILWDLGLIGLLLFLWVFASAWRVCLRLVHLAEPGRDRALSRTLLAAVACMPVMAFYWDGITVVPSQQLLAMLTVGLIAWQWRTRSTAAAPGPAATADPARARNRTRAEPGLNLA